MESLNVSLENSKCLNYGISNLKGSWGNLSTHR